MKRLAELQPPPDVHARIVAGAMERIEAGPRSMRWAMVAVAATALAAAAFLALQPKSDDGAPLIVVEEIARAPFEVEASPGADVVTEQQDDDATELFLGRGRVHFEVAKRKRGRFRVRTPSAVVEVVGTGFTVESQGLCTRVSVTHGVVRVTNADGSADVRLRAADTATRCLPEDTIDGEAWISEAQKLIAADERPKRVIRLAKRYRRVYPGGLFEEDALYALTVAYVRTNRRDKGRRVARTLVLEYPNSAHVAEVSEWFGL